MHARVLILRREGVRLDYNLAHIDKVPADKFVKGYFDYGSPTQTNHQGKCLMVRSATAAPGCGVICMLFQPSISQIQHTFMIFRGFEPVEENGVTAGYLQEWATFIC